MIAVRSFPYVPGEHEAEKASNSYLMSLIAVIAGLPLPIVNLIATLGKGKPAITAISDIK